MPYKLTSVKKFLDPSKFKELTQAVGKVVHKNVPGRVSVAVQLNRFNPYLKMYFPESQNLYVSDPNNTSILGDVVLITKLETPRRTVETHEIKDIVYTVGHTVDPLTGLRVNKDGYIGEQLDKDELKKMRQKMQQREISHEYSMEYDPSSLFTKEEEAEK